MKLKHVIVLHNPGASAEFLAEQGLINSTTGPNKDSSKTDELDYTLHGTRRDLQSTDGIQFYQFKQKFPRTNPGQFLGPEHLEYWTQVLGSKLRKKGQTLDAVVIPEPEGQLNHQHLAQWLAETRASWPNLKIMIVRPGVASGYGGRVRYETRIPGLSRDKAMVDAVEIAPGIDALVTANNSQSADALRELLGMAPRDRQALGRA